MGCKYAERTDTKAIATHQRRASAVFCVQACSKPRQVYRGVIWGNLKYIDLEDKQ